MLSSLGMVFASILILLGSAFALIAALGLVRMPDLYMRMHAATKAGTLGVGFIVFAVAVFFADLRVFVEAFIIVVFLLITAPIGAHVLARAAYLSGLQLWNLEQDDLKGCYNEESHILDNEPQPAAGKLKHVVN
ncbi:MAG: monovalent cation/H(+) antiporter subunit G [Trueperaceae bacterium]|nr:monovalent cation/H(+) antiporter subunit G [Trueperaceae bacterium]